MTTRAFHPSSPQARSINEVLELERRDRIQMNRAERLASKISTFAGSTNYVALHTMLFTVWMAFNTLGSSHLAFDPYPFQGLGLVVGLEVALLSTFVLMSQNREAIKEDRQAKVDLQVSMIAEQEITRLIGLMVKLHEHLGIPVDTDDELRSMQEPAFVTRLADAVDRAEVIVDPERAGGPESAIDTEK